MNFTNGYEITTEHLCFKPYRRDYLNITQQIEELVRKSGVRRVVPGQRHDITASVYINDAEDGLSKITTNG